MSSNNNNTQEQKPTFQSDLIYKININNHVSKEKVWVFGKEEYLKTINKQFSEITSSSIDLTIQTLDARRNNIFLISKQVFTNLTSLTNINLNDNKLKILPIELYSLPDLRILKLNNNQISYLSSHIGKLTRLETFSISNNLLQKLPSAIKFLTNMKKFDVSKNKINSLPIELGQLKQVESLFIDGNWFTAIPNTIYYMKNLKEICLEWMEYLDPPMIKHLNSGIGCEIIGFIRKGLQERMKKGELYCTFQSFVEYNSQSKSKKDIENNEFPLGKNSSNKLSKASKMKNMREKRKKENEENVENVDKVNVFTNKSKLEYIEDMDENEFREMNMKESNMMISQNLNLNENVKEVGQGNENKEDNIENRKKKYNRIFSAIENNYIGIIESLIKSDIEFFNIKNHDNRNPLYLSIHQNRHDVTYKILSAIDIKTIKNSFIYLHKAIKIRNEQAAITLLQLGVDPDVEDETGSNSLHHLMSSFTKEYSKCARIGDEILKSSKEIRVNLLNKDKWAPIHIATRRGCIESLYWITEKNAYLKKNGMEEFDFRLAGKSGWSPIHLCSNGYRYDITLLVLQNNINIFQRTTHGKTARKVCSGNYMMIRILRLYEEKQYKNIEKRYRMYDKQGKSNDSIEDLHVNDTLSDNQNESESEKLKGISSSYRDNSNLNKYINKNQKAISNYNNPDQCHNKSISLFPNSQFGHLISKSTNLNPYCLLSEIAFHYEILTNEKVSYTEKYDSIMKLKMVIITLPILSYSKIKNYLDVYHNTQVRGDGRDGICGQNEKVNMTSMTYINIIYDIFNFLKIVIEDLNLKILSNYNIIYELLSLIMNIAMMDYKTIDKEKSICININNFLSDYESLLLEYNSYVTTEDCQLKDFMSISKAIYRLIYEINHIKTILKRENSVKEKKIHVEQRKTSQIIQVENVVLAKRNKSNSDIASSLFPKTDMYSKSKPFFSNSIKKKTVSSIFHSNNNEKKEYKLNMFNQDEDVIVEKVINYQSKVSIDESSRCDDDLSKSINSICSDVNFKGEAVFLKKFRNENFLHGAYNLKNINNTDNKDKQTQK